MPAQGDARASDFALIAETDLNSDQILDCAEQVLRQRGGEPQRSRVGEFTTVRDRRRPGGEVAARRDGVFVFSGGLYFREVMDAGSGAPRAAVDSATRAREERHRDLQKGLGNAPLQMTYVVDDVSESALPGVLALGATLRVGDPSRFAGRFECLQEAACAELTQLGRALPGFELTQRGRTVTFSAAVPRAELVPLLRDLAGAP